MTMTFHFHPIQKMSNNLMTSWSSTEVEKMGGVEEGAAIISTSPQCIGQVDHDISLSLEQPKIIILYVYIFFSGGHRGEVEF